MARDRKTIMCVTAHPADPFDCAGGTLARHAEAGDRVVVVSITRGARSHAPRLYGADIQVNLDNSKESEFLTKVGLQKLSEFDIACRAVGAESICLDYADEPLLESRECINQIAELYRQYQPAVLITHHKAEMNNHDHPIAGEMAVRAVTSAARWLEGSRRPPHSISAVFFFGVQFRRMAMVYHAALPLPTTHVIDIEPVIQKKIDALKAFATQSYAGLDYSSDEYQRRRIAALEGYWGLINGVKFAEEFIALTPAKADLLG